MWKAPLLLLLASILSSGDAVPASATQRLSNKHNEDAYDLLAKAVRSRLKSDEHGTPELSAVTTAFKSLSAAQKTFTAQHMKLIKEHIRQMK